VFGHDDLSHDHEAVLLPCLFENRKKAVEVASLPDFLPEVSRRKHGQLF
jgi:hypothetical protein